MNRTSLLTQTRTAIRVVLFTTLGTGLVAGAGFAGTHLYLESKDPTPSEWPHKARFAYRAAVFNSEYLDQPIAAASNLRALLGVLVDTPTDESEDSIASQTNREGFRKSFKSSSDEGLAKALILYGNILRKQGDLEAAMAKYLQALPHSIFNMTLQSDAARRLGEIQEHLGLLQEAQQSLELAVQCVLPHYRLGTPVVKIEPSLRYSAELLSSVKALALFRARQGKLKDSLATLLSVLQFQQGHPSTQHQRCESAVTMTHIAELVWALGDKSECLRWSEKSLDLCTTGNMKSDKHCLECAGINHNMLGLLKMKSGEWSAARQEFGRALVYAERAEDVPGQQSYSENLDKCNES